MYNGHTCYKVVTCVTVTSLYDIKKIFYNIFIIYQSYEWYIAFRIG